MYCWIGGLWGGVMNPHLSHEKYASRSSSLNYILIGAILLRSCTWDGVKSSKQLCHHCDGQSSRAGGPIIVIPPMSIVCIKMLVPKKLNHPVNMWPKSIYLGPGLHKNHLGFQLFISDKPRSHVKKAPSLGPFFSSGCTGRAWRTWRIMPWPRHSNMLPPCFPPCFGGVSCCRAANFERWVQFLWQSLESEWNQTETKDIIRHHKTS